MNTHEDNNVPHYNTQTTEGLLPSFDCFRFVSPLGPLMTRTFSGTHLTTEPPVLTDWRSRDCSSSPLSSLGATFGNAVALPPPSPAQRSLAVPDATTSSGLCIPLSRTSSSFPSHPSSPTYGLHPLRTPDAWRHTPMPSPDASPLGGMPWATTLFPSTLGGNVIVPQTPTPSVPSTPRFQFLSHPTWFHLPEVGSQKLHSPSPLP